MSLIIKSCCNIFCNAQSWQFSVQNSMSHCFFCHYSMLESYCSRAELLAELFIFLIDSIFIQEQLISGGHDSPFSFSSAITICCHVILGQPRFLFPGGVHLSATLGMLSLGILRMCPSHLGHQCLISRTALLQPNLLIEFHVGNFIWPEYSADLSLTSIVEHIDLCHVPFNHSPAL